jgi:hypothetical protein
VSTSIPSMGPAPADRVRGETSLTRRSMRELARIYLGASAYASALEALSRLGRQSWDEETNLLRAEALVIAKAKTTLIPVRDTIHSSVVSTIFSRSALVRMRSG